jgi:hypothetical protein
MRKRLFHGRVTNYCLAATGLFIAGCSNNSSTPVESGSVDPMLFRIVIPNPLVIAQHVPESYLGDDHRCAACHAEIVTSYKQHSMGRSLTTIQEVTNVSPSQQEFESGGLTYKVEQRGGRFFHLVIRRDGIGNEISRSEGEIRYALGSGTRGISFLVERGQGFLTQSPISWYAQADRYDLAPGYAKDPLQFERPISTECLFCHAGAFEPLEGPSNAYTWPIFRQHAIGCERCHGPAREHVELQGDLFDDQNRLTVVNPSKLDPNLREAVCQQCHLQGETRVIRRDKSIMDFRPGQSLADTIAIFIKAESAGSGISNRAVGHTEQMEASHCYQASDGEMGCISCHEPHALPVPEEKVSYYRSRCLHCHADRGCALPKPLRIQQVLGDNCITCHMPRRGLADIAHTASTLHNIPRVISQDELSSFDPELEALASSSPPYLTEWHSERRDNSEAERDLGIALATRARDQADPSSAVGMARSALIKLDHALRVYPNDARGHEARASALIILGRDKEALNALETAVKLKPRDEPLLFAIRLAGQLGESEKAVEMARALVRLNPWQADHHAALASVLAQRQEWPAALESAKTALSLNAENRNAYQIAQSALKILGQTIQLEKSID